MSEQQDRPVGEQAAETSSVDDNEATFEESAAELEIDSEMTEESAGDLNRLLEEARAKADEH